VGRFLTKIWFWMRVPLESINFYVKIPKTAKKVFGSSDLLRKGHSLRGQAPYKGPKFFFSHNMGFMVVKRRKQIFWPIYSVWPQKELYFLKRSLDQKTFFCWFRYFYIKMNTFQGYSCASFNIDSPYCILGNSIFRIGPLKS
jgi:hypothetical protein